MQRRLLYVVAITVAALAVLTGGASASGPAPPGKAVAEFTCEGVGSFIVASPRGKHSNGVGQIVGVKGHGIPVATRVVATDLRTHEVVFEESSATGGGNGHPNQETKKCSGTVFTGPAEVVFEGGPYPPGVLASDEIELRVVVDVILKP